jgi:RNA ligase (TIGR02306 family)
MARKLASIQKISRITPIEYSDNIQLAHILGWEVVIKKDQFKEGDMVVYIEIDSILPDRPEFGFLKSKGMRIRPIRLRGQISNGICFPLDILPKDFQISEDADCTEALDIVKYEPPIPAHLSGIIKGKFPSFIPKTDETRVQILQPVLDKYKGTKCYVTEKLDGTSVTYYVKNGEFGVCSRNMELLEDSENTYWKIARSLDIENKLLSMHNDVAIQGEIFGENIQSNPLKMRGQHLRVFNVFDITKFRYYDFLEVEVILKRLNLDMVPVLDKDYILDNNIDSILKMATIRSTINNKSWAEGIVIRPYFEKLDLLLSKDFGNNGRVTFKAINPEFSLTSDY